MLLIYNTFNFSLTEVRAYNGKGELLKLRSLHLCVKQIIVICARQISGAHSWWAKTAQLCHRVRKQQHPRPAQSSEGLRNLPKWWSPRLCHGAVLATSKPLQVSKMDIFYACITTVTLKFIFWIHKEKITVLESNSPIILCKIIS